MIGHLESLHSSFNRNRILRPIPRPVALPPFLLQAPVYPLPTFLLQASVCLPPLPTFLLNPLYTPLPNFLLQATVYLPSPPFFCKPLYTYPLHTFLLQTTVFLSLTPFFLHDTIYLPPHPESRLGVGSERCKSFSGSSDWSITTLDFRIKSHNVWSIYNDPVSQRINQPSK